MTGDASATSDASARSRVRSIRHAARLAMAILAGIIPNACSKVVPSGEVRKEARLVVFAAASMSVVLQEIAARFRDAHGVEVVLNLDASSTLARQIEQGAPADIFLSADRAWMDVVATAWNLGPSECHDLAMNQLVMIAPKGSGVSVEATKEFDIAPFLTRCSRIAIADPVHVPAGRYARQSIEWLGWWTQMQPRMLPAKDVRAALRLVEISEADAGFVYATDARSSDTIEVLAVLPSASHDAIVYSIAARRGASPHADAFLNFLRHPDTVARMEAVGFTSMPASAASREPSS